MLAFAVEDLSFQHDALRNKIAHPYYAKNEELVVDISLVKTTDDLKIMNDDSKLAPWSIRQAES